MINIRATWEQETLKAREMLAVGIAGSVLRRVQYTDSTPFLLLPAFLFLSTLLFIGGLPELGHDTMIFQSRK